MLLPALLALAGSGYCLNLKLSPSSNIVGGTMAQEGEYPFMAKVLVMESNTCGGFILSRKWIGTAAHCVVDQQSLQAASAEKVVIMVGTSNSTNTPNVKRISRVVVAPGYSIDRQKNDLALLELEEELTLNDRIQPIPISKSKISDNQTFTAAGWGRTEDGVPSSNLMSVKLTTASSSKCRMYIVDFKNHNGPQICMDAIPGKDTCSGDSGGPLFSKNRNGTSLYGITSYSGYNIGASTTCGGDGTVVGVYTHVSHYISFIANTTGQSEQDLITPFNSIMLDTPSIGNAFSPDTILSLGTLLFTTMLLRLYS